MCARAWTFQASLERDLRTDHPNGDHDSVFRSELKTLLTTYYEDLRKVVGASGQEATRVLKHRRSIEPPPASGENVPAPVAPAGDPPPPAAAAGAAEPPRDPEQRPAQAPPSPAAARAAGKGAGGRAASGGKSK
jgi:hypothetical protein